MGTTAKQATAPELGPPRGMKAVRLAVNGDEYLVISYELDEPDLGELLTPAERDVARGLLRGWPMARIANERCTSLRTIANQARAIYAKLRVTSGLELAAVLRRKDR